MVAGEPANMAHLVHLAECCRAVGRTGEALRAYLDAAEAAINQGEDAGASAALDQAAALQPSDTRLQELRRRLSPELGQARAPEPEPPPPPKSELPLPPPPPEIAIVEPQPHVAESPVAQRETAPAQVTPAEVAPTGIAPSEVTPIEVAQGETATGASELMATETAIAGTTAIEIPATEPMPQEVKESAPIEIDLSAEWEAVEAAQQAPPMGESSAACEAVEAAQQAPPAGAPDAEWEAVEATQQAPPTGEPNAGWEAVEAAQPAPPMSDSGTGWEAVEAALQAPPMSEFNFDESAAEIDFYLEYGMADEARRGLNRLEAQFPSDPQVAELARKFEAPPSPVSVVPPAEPEPLAQLGSPARPESATPPAINPLDTLAQDLASSWQGPEQSVPNPPPVASPPPDSKVDFAASLGSLLSELGAEAAEARAREDPQTHHDLGIAFREMGLIDEAIGEFQKVVRGAQAGAYPPQFLSSCSLLALCFMEKQMPSLAVRWYARALELPHLDPEAALALHYDLGLAYEQAGNREAARERFLEVYSQNIDYRDVAEKVRQLAARP